MWVKVVGLREAGALRRQTLNMAWGQRLGNDEGLAVLSSGWCVPAGMQIQGKSNTYVRRGRRMRVRLPRSWVAKGVCEWSEWSGVGYGVGIQAGRQ